MSHLEMTIFVFLSPRYFDATKQSGHETKRLTSRLESNASGTGSTRSNNVAHTDGQNAARTHAHFPDGRDQEVHNHSATIT